MSREFEVTREVDLPAAPDDVWTAITAETAAWMFPTGGVPPAPRRRGRARQDLGPAQPPEIRMESPDGTFNALDYAIEARAGGTAHLRYVHSGILSDEWEDQYDAIGGHTDFYLHTLGQYLEHFNGRDVTYVGQPSDGISGPAAAGRAGRDGHAARRPRRPRRRRRRRGPRAPGRRRHARRRHRLLDAGVPRDPHRRRPVPLLRAQLLRAASSG